ncbi:PIN domain-containing protein [Moraxella caviae]|uniref:PIN domain n=1 Tax=Moraxella caviae TaxID=34060 RepID=A0A1T0AAP0_9GAMM|nr:type II toxin-antitoxin system VapC family toxin [Moraxella caviae]OOR92804.1 PIN domain-containing protein [Moraxella caviae]STZ14158.1 PIN domain [Moraxella caviae]VEW12604.1 PIN domain [Moraxella caviae]
MKVLLDTHILLWWQMNSPKLSKELINLVQNQASEVFVSRATLWEIAIKKSLGKIDVNLADLIKFTEDTGFAWLDIDEKPIINLLDLPVFTDHKDPFDRILISQSLTHNLLLLTADQKMKPYHSNIRVF